MGKNTLTKMFREDRDKRNLRTSLWHKRNKNKSYCTVAKARALKQGVPFDLCPDDIVFPTHCPVLGIPLFFTEGGRTDNTPSLDKLIPEKGYVKGNIKIISWKANRLKNNATLDELKKLVVYLEQTTKEEYDG